MVCLYGEVIVLILRSRSLKPVIFPLFFFFKILIVRGKCEQQLEDTEFYFIGLCHDNVQLPSLLLLS